MVSLHIDDLPVTVEKGATILTAATKLGIYIPTLCHHPDLTTFGGCRICMVEANGKLVTACRAPVSPGMQVRTDTPAARQVQKMVAELAIANHNMDCLTCVKDSDCHLQEVASFLGITKDRMRRLRRQLPVTKEDVSNPFFSIDRSRCILCGICIRTCDQINGVAAIDFGFRGHKNAVVTFANEPLADSSCESCGECLARCPTGALARKDYEKPSRRIKTICPYCGVGCGILLGVRGDRIVSVEGDRSNPVNKGRLCVKGRFGYHFINHPARLTKPLIRKEGVLTEAGWDEALDLIKSRFVSLEETHGSNCLGAISSARCTTEENYLFQKLFRSLGTNNIDHCARL
jgi:formate dehydrogenase major subunit